MIKSILAVCVGASGGATLRWLLGLALNSVFPVIPLGTLAANLLGGYCMGTALGIFTHFPWPRNGACSTSPAFWAR